MTDGRDRPRGPDRANSRRHPVASLTRRSVLEVAALVSLLGDPPGTVASTARAAADRTRTRSHPPVDVSAAERTATIDGRVGRHAEAVALDGRTALVGVPPSPDERGPADGGVEVLVRSGRTLLRQATLSPDGDAGQFGRAVALDDDTAVVGGELGPDPTGVHAGSAAVFGRTGGVWTRQATLGAPDTGGVDLFGTAVDVAADTVVVGASAATTDDGSGSGAAFVFTRSAGMWRRVATLTPPADDVEEFGRAVAIDGDTVVVGAHWAEEAASAGGVAFVFRRRERSWQRQAELGPSHRDRDDGFGTALDMAGETVVVGAPRQTNERGMNAGAAYAFARRSGRWRRQATLRDENGGATDQFGTAVALDGDVVLVGTNVGAGAVGFVRSDDGWTRVATLRRSDQNGSAVALDGARALVRTGGSRSDPGVEGSVEVFEP